MKITKNVVISFVVILVVALVSALNMMVLADSVSVDIYSSGSGWYRGEADGAAIGVHVSPGSEGEVIVVFNKELVNADKGTCSGNEWHYDASSGETNIYTNVYGIDFTSGISCIRTDFIPVSSPTPVPSEDHGDSDEEDIPSQETPSSDSESGNESHNSDTPSSRNDDSESSETESSSDSSETGDTGSSEENEADNENDTVANPEESILQEGSSETNPLFEGTTDNAQGNSRSTKKSQKSQKTAQQADVEDGMQEESGNNDTAKHKSRCLFWIMLLLILLILLLLRILYLYIYRKLRGKELWINIIPFGKLKEKAIILWDKFIMFIGKSDKTATDTQETNDVSSYEEFNDTNTVEGEVVNGYLQKSNIAPIRPIKSNVSNEENQRKAEENAINNKNRGKKKLQNKNEEVEKTNVGNDEKINKDENATELEMPQTKPTETNGEVTADDKVSKIDKETMMKTVQPSTGNVKYSNRNEESTTMMKEVDLDKQPQILTDDDLEGGNVQDNAVDKSQKSKKANAGKGVNATTKSNAKSDSTNNTNQSGKGKGKRKKSKGKNVNSGNRTSKTSNSTVNKKAKATMVGEAKNTNEAMNKNKQNPTTFADMLDRMHDL